MYNKKTGSLFEFSFAAPFIIKGESIKRIKFSKNYGSIFGRIFQIVDDLIDEVDSFKEIGKTPGKDKKQGKRTLLSVMGEKKARFYCEEIVENFIQKYKKEFLNYPILGDLLYYNINRLK
jgi:farnesyl diphosphate synthase